MKKVYLGAFLFAAIAGNVNAQNLTTQKVVNQIDLTSSGINPHTNSSNNQNEAKALGVEIWSDDFNDMTNWTIDNDGQASPFGWNIGSTVNSWWSAFSSGINSTSGGGFAEVNNGDYNANTQATNVVYSMTTNVIDIPNLPGNTTSTSSCFVQFEQFGALFNDSQRMLVSTDNGTTWSEVYTNNDRVTFLGNNPSAVYANPDLVQANIAGAIQGNPNNVQIRFEWTSRFPADPSLGAWTTFGWFIDDMKIITNPDIDIALDAGWHGDIINEWEYSQLTTTQGAAREMVPMLILSNNGQSTETLDVTCAINDGTSDVNTTVINHTIAPATTDTLWFSTGFMPGNGTYTVNFSVPADDVIGNDMLSTSTLTVGGVNMAHDYGATTSVGWDPASTNQVIVDRAQAPHSYGSQFLMSANEDVYGIDVQFASGTTDGLYVLGRIQQVDASTGSIQDPMTLITQIDHTVVAADNGTTLTLVFPSPVTLIAGETYVVEIFKVDGTTTEGFFVAASDGNGEDDDFGTANFGPYNSANPATYYNGWDYSPLVRPNFDQSLGLAENNLDGVSVYPNPTEGLITVTNTNNFDNTITVYDVAGNLVLSKEASSTTTIDLSANGTGVYIVKVNNENGIAVERVIVK